MALSAAKATDILKNDIIGTTDKLYIGLLVGDVDSKQEASYTGYTRPNLKEIGIHGGLVRIIDGNSVATEEAVEDNLTKTVAYVKNKDVVFFPEVGPDDEYTATVTGIAMYTAQSGGTPFFWAALPVENQVDIKANSVPIIRTDNLKLMVK